MENWGHHLGATLFLPYKRRGEPQKGAVGGPTAQPKTRSRFGTVSKNGRSMKNFIDLAILNILKLFQMAQRSLLYLKHKLPTNL